MVQIALCQICIRMNINVYIQIHGDLLKMIFFFSLLLRLGKTYTHIVTLKISLISFHFRIYENYDSKEKFKIWLQSSDLALNFYRYPLKYIDIYCNIKINIAIALILRSLDLKSAYFVCGRMTW